MSKLRGLPTEMKMRHDFHFVEELSARRAEDESNDAPDSVGRMIELDLLEVNPDQPRKAIGDLSDLVCSIKEKGVLEPVLVRRIGERFQIIAGERRFHASKAAGLSLIPCIEMEVDDRGVLEISLIENLQRRDLTPFEEADAILHLCEKFSYTHEKVAQKLSKSRTTVTELLSIGTLPEDVRELCRRADISSKSLLVEVARQNSTQDMARLIDMIASRRLSRDDARKVKSAIPDVVSTADGTALEPGRPVPVPPRPFTFKFHSPEQRFSVNLKFDKAEVRKDEILSALKDLIQQIESSEEISS